MRSPGRSPSAGLLLGLLLTLAAVVTYSYYITRQIGSLRENSFREIWFSQQARALRASIAAGECHCTNEVFLWPSIAFQPLQLARAWVSSTRTPVASSATASPAPR